MNGSECAEGAVSWKRLDKTSRKKDGESYILNRAWACADTHSLGARFHVHGAHALFCLGGGGGWGRREGALQWPPENWNFARSYVAAIRVVCVCVCVYLLNCT